MIIDSELVFDNAVPLTASAASTNVIDLLAQRNLGTSEPLTVSVMVDSTFTAAGAATLGIAFQTSPDNATWTTAADAGVIPVADMVEGAQLCSFDVPDVSPVGGTARYLRLDYTVTTGPFTAGALTSAIVGTKQVYTGYPSGYDFVPPAVQKFVA